MTREETQRSEIVAEVQASFGGRREDDVLQAGSGLLLLLPLAAADASPPPSFADLAKASQTATFDGTTIPATSGLRAAGH